MNDYDDDIEENEEEEKGGRSLKKFWFVLIVFNLLFFLLILRLFLIQVVNADRFKERAKDQHEYKLELKAERGKIYDRNGKLIASTLQSLSVAVDPRVLKSKAVVCKALSKATGIPYRKFLQKINSSKRAYEWLARGINPTKSKELEKLNIPGLIKIKEPKRIFLYGEVAAQVIGANNIDNKGISGIERSYDSLLKGEDGYMILQRDAKNRLHMSADLPMLAPKNGKSLKLSLDIELQRIIEYELKQGVIENEARSGTVVAIEPRTGEVLAMASYPTFNPNNLSERTPGSMKNKAITDTYEPGSTFKVVTAAAALEEGVVATNTIFNGYKGLLEFDRYLIRDDHPVGMATFEHAMEISSNIIFAQVGDLLSVNKFYKYLRDFGFGNTLGIDIFGEVQGRLPKAKRIYPADKQYISHGYGISVTALQMAAAYAAIANGGVLMRPVVVREITSADGDIIDEHEPQKIRKVVSEETCDTITNMLVKVVETGTGKRAKVKGIEIAGKTGTAQQLVKGKWTKQYFASFAGYFPAHKPEIAMIVIIDKPEKAFYGGVVAAPIFNNISKRWIAINPNLASEYDEEKFSDSVTIPSVKGYFSEDALKILRDFELNPKLFNLNDGIVISQDPKEGTKVEKGTEITVIAKRYKTLITDTLDRIVEDKDYRPDVIGMSVKKAIGILHKAGIKVRVKGSGLVRKQTWNRNKKEELICTIHCSMPK